MTALLQILYGSLLKQPRISPLGHKDLYKHRTKIKKALTKPKNSIELKINL